MILHMEERRETASVPCRLDQNFHSGMHKVRSRAEAHVRLREEGDSREV